MSIYIALLRKIFSALAPNSNTRQRDASLDPVETDPAKQLDCADCLRVSSRLMDLGESANTRTRGAKTNVEPSVDGDWLAVDRGPWLGFR